MSKTKRKLEELDYAEPDFEEEEVVREVLRRVVAAQQQQPINDAQQKYIAIVPTDEPQMELYRDYFTTRENLRVQDNPLRGDDDAAGPPSDGRRRRWGAECR